jgi:hypothetical protein
MEERVFIAGALVVDRWRSRMVIATARSGSRPSPRLERTRMRSPMSRKALGGLS